MVLVAYGELAVLGTVTVVKRRNDAAIAVIVIVLLIITSVFFFFLFLFLFFFFLFLIVVALLESVSRSLAPSGG